MPALLAPLLFFYLKFKLARFFIKVVFFEIIYLTITGFVNAFFNKILAMFLTVSFTPTVGFYIKEVHLFATIETYFNILLSALMLKLLSTLMQRFL